MLMVMNCFTDMIVKFFLFEQQGPIFEKSYDNHKIVKTSSYDQES